MYYHEPVGVKYKVPVFTVGECCYIVETIKTIKHNRCKRRYKSIICKAKVLKEEWWQENMFFPVYYDTITHGIKGVHYRNVHFGEIFVDRKTAQMFSDSNNLSNQNFYKKQIKLTGTVNLHRELGKSVAWIGKTNKRRAK